MNINVKCFASLSNDDTCRHDQAKSISLGADNATVGSLLEHVQVDQKEISTVFVNGRQSSLDDRISDGDRVAFVPAVGGM
jgi:molybdopterin converting factor small subunit